MREVSWHIPIAKQNMVFLASIYMLLHIWDFYYDKPHIDSGEGFCSNLVLKLPMDAYEYFSAVALHELRNYS
jgi:hypothetical protein